MNHKYNNILQSTTLTKQSISALSLGNVGCRVFLTRDEYADDGETVLYERGWYQVAVDSEGTYFWEKVIEASGAGTIIGYYDSETDKFYKDPEFKEELETEIGSICVDITDETKPIEYVCYEDSEGNLGYRLENYTRHKEVAEGTKIDINNADLLQGNSADSFVKKNNVIHKYINYEYEDGFVDEIDHMSWEV